MRHKIEILNCLWYHTKIVLINALSSGRECTPQSSYNWKISFSCFMVSSGPVTACPIVRKSV